MNGYFYLHLLMRRKKQWFAKVYHKLLDLEIEVVGMDMLKHFRYSSNKISTEINIKEEKNDLLRIDMKGIFGEEEVSLHELQKILYAGSKAVLLKTAAWDC